MKMAKASANVDAVFDAGRSLSAVNPRQTTIKEVARIFLEKQAPKHPLNFLDWANRTPITFTPRPIQSVAVERQLLPSWFVLSTKTSISPWHIDNAGQLSWLMVIEGQKVVYLRRGSLREQWYTTDDEECHFEHVGGYSKYGGQRAGGAVKLFGASLHITHITDFIVFATALGPNALKFSLSEPGEKPWNVELQASNREHCRNCGESHGDGVCG